MPESSDCCEEKELILDIDQLMLQPVNKCCSGLDCLGIATKEFSRLVSCQTKRKSFEYSSILKNLDVILEYYERQMAIWDSLTSPAVVRAEFNRLILYRKVVALFAESVSTEMTLHVPVRDGFEAFEIIRGFLRSRQTVASLFVSACVDWLRETGVHEKWVPPAEPVNIATFSPRTNLLSYEEFWASLESGVGCILTRLGFSDRDPFLSRTVDKHLTELLATWNVPMACKTRVVQRWFVSSVDLKSEESISLNTVEYFRKYLSKDAVELGNSDVLHNVALLSSLQDEALLHSYLTLVPGLLAIPGSTPGTLSGSNWICTLAIHCLSNPNHSTSWMNTMDILQDSTSSAWDMDAIPVFRSFGQFQIGCENPVEALLEVLFGTDKFLEIRKFDKSFFSKIFLLLMAKFGKQHAGLILRMLDQLEDVDRPAIAMVVFGETYREIFETVWFPKLREGEPLVDCDITLVQSALSVARLAGTERVGSGESIFKSHPLSMLPTTTMAHLELVGVSLESKFFHPFNGNVLDWLVEASLATGSAEAAAFRLGLSSVLHVAVAQRLLDMGFDSDVEAHLAGIEVADKILIATVAQRLSAVVKALSEDTSRFHGIVGVSMTQTDLVDLLNTPSGSPEHSALLKEWIREPEGAAQMVQTCTRLLQLPELLGSELAIRFRRVCQQLTTLLEDGE